MLPCMMLYKLVGPFQDTYMTARAIRGGRAPQCSVNSRRIRNTWQQVSACHGSWVQEPVLQSRTWLVGVLWWAHTGWKHQLSTWQWAGRFSDLGQRSPPSGRQRVHLCWQPLDDHNSVLYKPA
jgi:hypothetical protein